MADAPFDVRIVQQLFFSDLLSEPDTPAKLELYQEKILPCALIFIGCRHGAYKFRSQRQRPFFNGEVKVVFAVFPHPDSTHSFLRFLPLQTDSFHAISQRSRSPVRFSDRHEIAAGHPLN